MPFGLSKKRELDNLFQSVKLNRAKVSESQRKMLQVITLPRLPSLRAQAASEAKIRAVEDLDRRRRLAREDTGYIVCLVFADRERREKWLRENGHPVTGEPVEFVAKE